MIGFGMDGMAIIAHDVAFVIPMVIVTAKMAMFLFGPLVAS